MRVVMTLFGLLCLAATPTMAGPVIINLARPQAALTIPVTPGTVVTFHVVNMARKHRYQVTVEQRIRDIPPFESVPVPTFRTDDPCNSLNEAAAKLTAADDEQQVPALIGAVDDLLQSGACKGDTEKVARSAIARTTDELPNQYVVHAGTEVIVTVSRMTAGGQQKTWTTTIDGGPRGSWLTTYGVSTLASDDERFFAQPNGDGNTYVITREQKPEEYKVLPSVFFTWLSRSQSLRNWAVGPTAGIGITDRAPGVFAGLGVTYNHNLGVIGGLAMSQQTRLRGRYAEGTQVAENLGDEQLNRSVYRPSAFAAVTFRFGSNPFGDDKGKATEEEKKQASVRSHTTGSSPELSSPLR